MYVVNYFMLELNLNASIKAYIILYAFNAFTIETLLFIQIFLNCTLDYEEEKNNQNHEITFYQSNPILCNKVNVCTNKNSDIGIFITKCYLIQIGSVLLSFNLIIYFQKHTIQAWRCILLT